MLISLIILILIIYRLYYNNLYRRKIDIRISSSVFDDNISLILVANTYLIFLIYHLTWISLTFRTFIGDFFLSMNILNLGDSIACRIQVGIIFFLTSALYHSFLLQALSRLFNIIFISRLNTIKICRMSLDSIWIYILMILFSWFVSFIVLIPTYSLFNVFSYFPEQYHCLISFSNVKGFVYALFVCYLIPICPILYIYSRVIFYVCHLPKRGVLMRTRREVNVIKYILKICLGVSVLGLPTLFFLFQFIITGHIHPLADRIHELCIAINSIGFTLGFAILNSFNLILPRLSDAQERNNMMDLQQFDS